MKRYLIFAALGPFLGGFLLLFATTYASGYWHQTNAAEVAKLFVVFAKTLQYSYLFGVIPALMVGAVDDILFHVRRIHWVVRMLILGAVGFAASELLYGSRGADSGFADRHSQYSGCEGYHRCHGRRRNENSGQAFEIYRCGYPGQSF